ncbi:hypothetical protein CFH99_13535 [Nocardioides aromaticivorans]|uniref:Maltokinase N-terminal cap domain-containing protein n=1 Tax=Nocardioides aromaticivorans TaxID=200618 RepID=A0ABX7PLE7_9ACTN|nr:hypothetical protein [Nocardioides aromaticivorans]QSR26649.1 hypothetical protein CFH99_13535 [Nocardioides aromaticivorans]
MAVVHSSATIRPTKQELLETVLDGPVEIVGAYRFDDPDGEVGVEGFLVRRDDLLQHVLFSYRGAILAEDGARLVGTMEHSELGPRWIYDGATDPVAVACVRRAILGEQAQAVLELWEDGRLVGTREPAVRVSPVAGDAAGSTAGGTGDPAGVVHVLREPEEAASGPALLATWDGGRAVIARLD